MAQRVLVDREIFRDMILKLNVAYLLHADPTDNFGELMTKIDEYESKLDTADNSSVLVLDPE